MKNTHPAQDFDLPLGFSMALAENPSAMQRFASLSQQQQKKVIAGTHHIASSADMRAYVCRLLEDDRQD